MLNKNAMESTNIRLDQAEEKFCYFTSGMKER